MRRMVGYNDQRQISVCLLHEMFQLRSTSLMKFHGVANGDQTRAVLMADFDVLASLCRWIGSGE